MKELEEEWRPIAAFPGYDVSNLGRVRSWRPRNGQGGLVAQPRLMSFETNKHGYFRVGFRLPGERKKIGRLVHQLVLETFVGAKPAGMCGCHNDDVKTNNVLTNLRWDTPKSNGEDMARNGRAAVGDRNGSRLHPERLKRGNQHPNTLRPERMPRGCKHYAARIDEQTALAIHRAHGTYNSIAAQFNVSIHIVTNIKHGKSWSHVTGARYGT